MRQQNMNNRERFIRTILFENPDKIPFMPGAPRESTLKAWREQGFVNEVHYLEQLADILAIDIRLPQESYDLGVSFKMIPMFEEKVLEHKDGHYIVQDWMGAITEISDKYDLSYLREPRDFVTRKWHKFPVENRDDWAEMKIRFSTVTEGRFSKDFDERVAKSHDSAEIVELEVAETDPGLKGDTAQGGTKPATLSSGAVVKVPLFVNIGDVLRVDTRTGEYQNRVNK